MEGKNKQAQVVVVEVAKCRNCGAECTNGNDDDMMITCAFCGDSFVPKKLTELTQEEYDNRVKNAVETRSRNGWFAIRSK